MCKIHYHKYTIKYNKIKYHNITYCQTCKSFVNSLDFKYAVIKITQYIVPLYLRDFLIFIFRLLVLQIILHVK
jgi:hypothetical protein